MNITLRSIARLLVPASLALLAACQTLPGGGGRPGGKPETMLQVSSKGEPVAVFLANSSSQPGWRPVQVQASTLYLNPQPVVTREDLVGVRAGTSSDGAGLLALVLNQVGQRKVSTITAHNPNMRLALVVGRTMLAAPSYTSSVTSDQLVFSVGTEQNAVAAAGAIAGVDGASGSMEAK